MELMEIMENCQILSLLHQESLSSFLLSFLFFFSDTFRKHKIIVLSDEIYARLHFKQNHVSLVKVSIYLSFFHSFFLSIFIIYFIIFSSLYRYIPNIASSFRMSLVFTASETKIFTHHFGFTLM